MTIRKCNGLSGDYKYLSEKLQFSKSTMSWMSQKEWIIIKDMNCGPKFLNKDNKEAAIQLQQFVELTRFPLMLGNLNHLSIGISYLVIRFLRQPRLFQQLNIAYFQDLSKAAPVYEFQTRPSISYFMFFVGFS